MVDKYFSGQGELTVNGLPNVDVNEAFLSSLGQYPLIPETFLLQNPELKVSR